MFSKYRKGVFQFLSIHGMVVDIQHFRQLCQLEDEYAHEPSEVFDQEAPTLIANVVTESPKQKRKRNKKTKYSPSDDAKDNVSANLVATPTTTHPTPSTTPYSVPNVKYVNGESDRTVSTTNNKKCEGKQGNGDSRNESAGKKAVRGLSSYLRSL